MATILLVDAEPASRERIADLREGGYTILTASGYESAVAILNRTKVDAAVIDTALPDGTGAELLNSIRNREPYIPSILLAGELNIRQVADIVRGGACELLAKPVTTALFLAAISRALERKRLIDEKRRLERLVKEETLRESQAHLTSIIASATDAVVTIDAEQRIVLFNAAAEQVFRCPAEEALGKPVDQFIPGRFREAHSGYVRAFGETNKTNRTMGFLGSISGLRADGEEFPAEASISQVEVGGRKLYTAILRDISERKRAEEELEQMQARLVQNEKIAALGQAAAQVAHEVKNPLAGLRLYALHLQGKVSAKLSKDEIDLVDKIVGCIDHLSNTVDRVLDFARPIKLSLLPVDINRIVTAAIQVLEPQMAANKVEHVLDISSGRLVTMLDEAAMKSAMINLILNAVEAMAGGGQLSVTTAATGSSLEICIRDTGCGMSDEQVENVFEPFHSTKKQGLGLGMSYAKKVIEQHQGTISVESRTGKGTRVELTLPAKELE